MSESDQTPPGDDNDLSAQDVNVVPSADEPDEMAGTAEVVDLPAEEE